jgi:hypothetical protein
MTAVVVTAVIVLVVFIAGGITGAVLLVSLASRREDREMLSERAPNRIALAGRFVTGLKVEQPRSRIDGPVDGEADEMELAESAYHSRAPGAW